MELDSITSDHIFQFLTQDAEGQKQSTKRFKYILLKTLFNFIKNSSDPSFVNWATPAPSRLSKKRAEKSVLKSALMISGAMRLLMPAGPGRLSRSSARSSSGTPIFRPLNDISEESVTPRPAVGWKIFSVKK